MKESSPHMWKQFGENLFSMFRMRYDLAVHTFTLTLGVLTRLSAIFGSEYILPSFITDSCWIRVMGCTTGLLSSVYPFYPHWTTSSVLGQTHSTGLDDGIIGNVYGTNKNYHWLFLCDFWQIMKSEPWQLKWNSGITEWIQNVKIASFHLLLGPDYLKIT